MQYDTIFSIWKIVMLYTICINAAVYLLLGLTAVVLHRRGLVRALIVALFIAIFGLLTAAGMAAVTTLLIAALYITVDARMSNPEALLFGCGQGFFIVLLNTGLFHRIL